MSERVLSLDRLDNAPLICEIFKKSSEEPERIANVRYVLIDILREYNVRLLQADVVGSYLAELAVRELRGLWPVNYDELCYVLFCMSQFVFDNPTVDTAMRWVRHTGAYHWLIDQSEWRGACDRVEHAIRSTLAT